MSGNYLLLRRVFRSLRPGFLVISIVLAFLIASFEEGKRQERIGAQLVSAQCSVGFSHMKWVAIRNLRVNFPGTPVKEQSTLPELVESLDLAPILRRIEHVTLRSSDQKVLAEACAAIKSIGQFKTLSFYDTGISEVALADLLAHIRIQQLYLRNEVVGRGQLDWLNHDGLTWLSVSRTHFSNPAIDSLPMTLQSLDATRTRINDAGLDKFVRLSNLRHLNLRRTPTSPAAVEALRKKMPECEIQWEPLTKL